MRIAPVKPVFHSLVITWVHFPPVAEDELARELELGAILERELEAGVDAGLELRGVLEATLDVPPTMP